MSTFKRILCISALALLTMNASTFALPADEEKPFIFINSASHIGGLASNRVLSVFAKLAREAGFEIDHGIQTSLSADSALDGISVYVLWEPSILFLEEDRIALRKWVRNGGVLLTANSFFPAKIDSFLGEFGVQHGPWVSSDRRLLLTKNSPLAGPNKLNEMNTSYYRRLMITDKTRAEAILNIEDDGPAIIRSISNAGKGEIIVIGCPNVFYDFEGAPVGIDYWDNEELAQNLLEYIGGRFGLGDGYDLDLISLKTKGDKSFFPGDKIKFAAKIKNIGNSNAEATNIVFYLEKNGPASRIRYEIASTKVPAIKANKKTKVVGKAFLPNDLQLGSYEVVAVIDPNNNSNDANTSNNTITTKKKIIIE